MPHTMWRNEHTAEKRHINMPRIDATSRIVSGTINVDVTPPSDGGLIDEDHATQMRRAADEETIHGGSAKIERIESTRRI